MGNITMKIPHFNSEEEANWWYDNRERIGEEFAQAMREGLVSSGKGLTIQQRIENMRRNAALIRLPDDDLALARKLADDKGVHYREYVKSLLHEALQAEEKRASATVES
jgi:predicted DNA binding CopG/RHH family protein